MMVAAQFKVDPAEFAGRRVLVTGGTVPSPGVAWFADSEHAYMRLIGGSASSAMSTTSPEVM